MIESKAKDIPVKETRPKTTMNLGSILKGQPKEETKKEEQNRPSPSFFPSSADETNPLNNDVDE